MGRPSEAMFPMRASPAQSRRAASRARISQRGSSPGGQAAVGETVAGEWRWVVGGYLHAVDISGTNTVGDIEVPIELGFGDLFGAIKVP